MVDGEPDLPLDFGQLEEVALLLMLLCVCVEGGLVRVSVVLRCVGVSAVSASHLFHLAPLPLLPLLPVVPVPPRPGRVLNHRHNEHQHVVRVEEAGLRVEGESLKVLREVAEEGEAGEGSGEADLELVVLELRG